MAAPATIAPPPASAAEKEEFKNYLEKSGAVDALTRVLAGLFSERDKPQNVIEFLKQHLGPPSPEVNDLKKENEALKKQCDDLKKQVDDLTRQLGEAKKAEAQQPHAT